MRRMTPDDDVDRLAERFESARGERIKDKQSFEEEFDDFLGGDLTATQRGPLRRKVFDKVVKKRRVAAVERKARKRRKIQAAKDFPILATSGGKQVFAKKVIVTIRGKRRERFRDKLGRWARKVET